MKFDESLSMKVADSVAKRKINAYTWETSAEPL